jgi:hypothetical protein
MQRPTIAASLGLGGEPSSTAPRATRLAMSGRSHPWNPRPRQRVADPRITALGFPIRATPLEFGLVRFEEEWRGLEGVGRD